MKRLRGTRVDPFGWTAERRLDRRMIAEYRAMVEGLAAGLRPQAFRLATQIATLPLDVKGFGHVKIASVARYEAERGRLLDAFRTATRLS